MDNEKLFGQLAAFAAEILNCQPICQFFYHNLDHTRSVVKNVEIIGKHEDVNEESIFVLKVSAWFHDLGYANSYTRHEDESIKLAQDFLGSRNMQHDLIERVVKGIDATRVPQCAKSLSENIMADADLFDLGTDNYFKQSENLWKEWNKNLKEFSELEFWQISYDFVKAHSYFTDYAKKFLEPKKQENLAILEKMLVEMK